jgi:hypothetical protein
LICTGELFPADKRRSLEAGHAISSGDWLKLGGTVCNLQSHVQLHNGVRACEQLYPDSVLFTATGIVFGFFQKKDGIWLSLLNFILEVIKEFIQCVLKRCL